MIVECDERLKQRIRDNLARFAVEQRGDHRHRSAAVAIAVADEAYGADLSGLPVHAQWQSSAALILTRRSSQLRDHAGQWALPGGRIDEGETPEQTALREMSEEVGLTLDALSVLGRLDDFVTRSGYAITPIVVWAGPRRELQRNPTEVETIHRIPVEEFMRDDAPLLEAMEGSDHPVLRMPVGDSWIAAPTAAMLFQFREVCIAGRATRVAHYEQPQFAWR
jgi:8-oxo-dGTP pyrophosphatase MutT (NUDIX family)